MRRVRGSLVARSLLLTGAVVLGAASPAGADADVSFGKSDAENIVLLHAYYPGYWWDHTDLTVAVLSAPNVDPVFVDSIRDAIATWTRTLERKFPIVSLTDVTDTARNPQQADIVVHYVAQRRRHRVGRYRAVR